MYRDIAAARPDRFCPALAMAVNNLGVVFRTLGRHEEALASAGEAISTLAPMFLADYDTFEEWMLGLVRTYVTRCTEQQREPDPAVLDPVVEEFKKRNTPVDSGS